MEEFYLRWKEQDWADKISVKRWQSDCCFIRNVKMYVANGRRLIHDFDCDYKDDANMILNVKHISQSIRNVYCRPYITEADVCVIAFAVFSKATFAKVLLSLHVFTGCNIAIDFCAKEKVKLLMTFLKTQDFINRFTTTCNKPCKLIAVLRFYTVSRFSI